MDEFSAGEPLAEVFDEPWVARFGRVVELFVAVVGFAGCEQPGAGPCLDRVVVHAELFGDLGEREHPGGVESGLVAAELVALAEAFDDVAGERLAVEGPEVLGVEDRGDLAFGVFVEELVDLGDQLGRGFALLTDGGREREREAGGLPASEADVKVDLVGAVQRDVVDQQPRDAFAFTGGCRGI